MRKIWILILLIGCVPEFDAEKLYRQEIALKSGKLEWYFHSLIGNTTPEYLVYTEGEKEDTICIADNLEGIFLSQDTINLFFSGEPKKYGKSIEIKQIEDYFIQIDTTAKRSHKPKPSYTRE